MKKIRKNVFETNSSSTHSIAIPRNFKNEYPNVIHFGFGEFGWEFDEVSPSDYLYTAIYDIYSYDEQEELEKKLNFLKSALEKRDIRYTMEEPKFTQSVTNKSKYYFDSGYIDHGDELRPFIDTVFKDEDTLLTFIFYGLVFTANDNEDTDGFIDRAEKFLSKDHYNKETGRWETEKVTNQYYSPEYENYDWYYKGN